MFVSGVGTGGAITGASRYIKSTKQKNILGEGRPAQELERLGEVTAPHLRPRPADSTPQKLDGYATVEITPPQGALQADQIRRLADVVERFGEGIPRTTHWQNAVLRWVSEEELPALHAELAGLGLGADDPAILKHLVSCAGASTCRLGICLSRGLAEAIRGALLGMI